jgi:hypothetical protein
MDEQAEPEPDRTWNVTGCGSGCGLLAADLAGEGVGLQGLGQASVIDPDIAAQQREHLVARLSRGL